MSDRTDETGSGQRRPRGESPQKMSYRMRLNLGYAAVALLGVLILQAFLLDMQRTADLPYSDFLSHLEEGRIESVSVGSETVEGTFKEPVDGKKAFVTGRVEGDLLGRLDEQGVTYDGQVEDTFLAQVLSWVIPIAIFALIWYFLIRRLAERQGGMASGLMQIGQSKARVSYEEDIETGFGDVAGIDEAKADLKEIVSFLQSPEEHGRLGARPPKGVLLTGPPGTGKTLVARAVAGEAGVPFFYINGSEFVEMFVGVGAARTRDLFRQARERAPCIIFIDELDALGQARGGGMSGMAGGGNDEKEQTLNQLLVELDGFDASTGLVVIGATNRAEVLDPALLRAGRFDRRIGIDRPDKASRAAILGIHLGKVKQADDIDVDRIAQMTPGFTGADLENLVNEAALLATRRDAEAVEMQDVSAGLERIVAGQRKHSRVLSEPERVRVAHHELGHAILAFTLEGTDPVQKVSIIPRSMGALGFSMERPSEDRYLMTRGELEDRMALLLGGRAAERVFFDDVSNGAADDLKKVTDLARQIVTRFGMTDALGLAVYEEQKTTPEGLPLPGSGQTHAEETARQIDETVRRLIDEAYARAVETVEDYRDAISSTAERLLERETMEERELREALGVPAR
jgi:cell division protease FtsH